MPKDNGQVGGARGRTARKDKADRISAHLESEIAATADQRAVLLKALDDSITVTPHRDHHAYHLGADLFYCGLATGDGVAMMGLMSMGPAHVGRLLLDAARTQPNLYVARLWPKLLDAQRDEYEARGRLVVWQRGWARYRSDAESWARTHNDGSWRALHMTRGQRYLVQDTAIMIDVDIPEEMSRGDAHDWLMRNGANLPYRKEA